MARQNLSEGDDMKTRNGLQAVLILILCFNLNGLAFSIDKPIDKMIERGDGEPSDTMIRVENEEDSVPGPMVDEKPPAEGVSDDYDEPDLLKIEMEKSLFLQLDKIKVFREKPAERLTNQEIETYITFIRGGGIFKDVIKVGHLAIIENGSQLMKHISYHHLARILLYIDKKAEKMLKAKGDVIVPPLFETSARKKKVHQFYNRSSFLMVKGDNRVREKVIESTLGGLLNPDPRVRLISVHLLRRLIPKPTTWTFVNERVAKQKALKSKESNANIGRSPYYETVHRQYYIYHNLNKRKSSHIIYIELLKLRRFISRAILVKQIQSGDTRTIREIPRRVFRLLDTRIENESHCRIPMNYFTTSTEVSVITAGLKNKDLYIRRGCARSLLRILRTQDVDNKLRRRIFKTLLRSEFRELVAVGWTDEEVKKLSNKKTDEMLKRYRKKNGLIPPCPADAQDLYDSPKDPAGYAPAPFKNDPIVKGVLDKTKGDKKSDKDSKAVLEENYIYE